MSLSNSAKQFFINRITQVLDEKIKNEMTGIDRKKVDEHGLSRLISDAGMEDKFAEFKDTIEKIESIEKITEELREEIAKAIDSIFRFSYPSYHSNRSFIDDLKEFAKNHYYDKAMNELYPEQTAEINRLQDMKKDVEGAVLLSTTTPNLRYALTRLLQKYGGDLSSIEQMLPEE